MNKFLKIFLIVFISIIATLYVLFLALPPIFNTTFNFDKYKSDIQKIIKETSKLNLNYSEIKLYTTPLLSAGLIINDIEVKFDDNSTLFKSSKIKGGIALPSLLTLTVKTAKCDIENPNINLEIIDDKEYKIITLIENIVNENIAKPQQTQNENEFVNKIVEKIRIKIPTIKITNYEATVNDLKTSHNLKLNGEELILGYNSANNSFKIKTNAKLLSDNKENILANIDIKANLPKTSTQNKKQTQNEKINIPFINIVKIYQTYDLKAKIDSKLKLKSKNKCFISNGYINIDDINLKLSDIRLPNSYIHIITKGKKVEFDSNLYAKENEKIALNGNLKYGKNPKIETNIKTDKIYFASLTELIEALLDSLGIQNNLNEISANGYFSANTSIKTDFKKITSNGSIEVKNGAFTYPKYNLKIQNFIANILLDNNTLNIKDTSLLINNSKLSAKGTIDTNSNTNITIETDKLSLSELYKTFAPKEIKNQYTLNSGIITAQIDITGKLEDLKTKLNTKLDNLNIQDNKKTLFITNKSLNMDFDLNPKTMKGTFSNTGFNLNMPQAKIKTSINSANIDLDNKTITLKPFDLIYNNSSKINVKGNINNYMDSADVDLFIDGKISTNDIIQTLGKEIAFYLPHKGSIPAKIAIKGNLEKQQLQAQLYADSNNYITPINLNSLLNNKSVIHVDTKIDKNKIKIKNSGLYKIQGNFSDNLENNILNAQKIAELNASINGNNIETFKINISDIQQGQIAIFKNSTFKTKGNISLNGKFDDLNYGGNLKLWDINIPELLIKANSIDLDFISQGLNLKGTQIDINGSKIDGSMKANLKPAKIFKITNTEIKSDSINVDNMMKTLDLIMNKAMPQTTTSTSSSQNANIPIYMDGAYNIKKLTTGAIVIENITGDLKIQNNDLYLDNLNCKAFKGDVSGKIKMNLITSLLTINLKGQNLDTNEALVKAANMKDTLSGKLKFNTDISLKGATYYEQMKSLKGKIDFEIDDGQYGPFAKIENFILAQNVRENSFFKNTIGTIITPLATIDTTHFEKLKGEISFNNGIATFNSITSQGDILSALVSGKMNLLTNKLDATVRGRLASSVSDLMGPLALANPINLVQKTPGVDIVGAKLFSTFSQVVTQKEYDAIPDFSKNHSDEYATKFQIILNGDTTKPLTLVKSFKWLVLQDDMNKANTFSTNFLKEQEELLKEQLNKTLQNAQEAKNNVVNKVVEQKQAAIDNTKQNIQNTIETKKQEAKDQIKSKLQEKLKIPNPILN